jgi:5-formyltetrahydrofolate cyclo-ligase
MDKLDKKILRSIYLKKRMAISTSDLIEKSGQICKKVLTLPQINTKKNFSTYLPVNNEVDIKILIDDLIAQAKTVLVPCYFKKSKDYHFSKFTNWRQLEKGPFEILQPKNPKVVDSSGIEIAILPGLAFSKTGVRLGYGKGVFDKLLSRTNALKIGLAYDFQVVDAIPNEKHDLLMNFVVTEKTIYSIDATFG